MAIIETLPAAIKIHLLVLALFACQLCACQNRKDPNLSERRLKELMSDSALFPKREPTFTNNVPAGEKYAEIRAVDPLQPPEIIDIAGNLENKKTFKLSDIASSVRYIVLQPPEDIKFTSSTGVVSDDEHIFINTREGLFCYSAQGQYLYTVCKNDLEQTPYGTKQISGTLFFNRIDLLNGQLIARIVEDGQHIHLSVFDVKEMDDQLRFNFQNRELKKTGATPQYKRPLTGNSVFMPTLLWNHDQSLFGTNLAITSIYGDSLCKFNDYDTYTLRPGQGAAPIVRSKAYRFNGYVIFQKDHNDTVFRVIPPNRLI